MIPGLDRLKTLAGRAYVAPRLEDAVAIAARWGPRACASLGYRNVKGEDPGRIALAYREAVDAAARSGTCRVSVKLPPLGFEAALIGGIVRKAADEQVRLQVDAMGHESADATFAAIARATVGAPIGVTLPGRWRRSRHDAALAVSMEWPVRVVKGEWTDPTAPDLDPALGFLAVVDALAGRASHVSVATHDEPLARESLRRLVDRHTPCVLELLHGFPLEGPVGVARSLGVPVRLYIPYGQPALPYALSLRAPDGRMLARGVRDLMRGRYHARE